MELIRWLVGLGSGSAKPGLSWVGQLVGWAGLIGLVHLVGLVDWLVSSFGRLVSLVSSVGWFG
jgi:hypothetical protein